MPYVPLDDGRESEPLPTPMDEKKLVPAIKNMASELGGLLRQAAKKGIKVDIDIDERLTAGNSIPSVCLNVQVYKKL